MVVPYRIPYRTPFKEFNYGSCDCRDGPRLLQRDHDFPAIPFGAVLGHDALPHNGFWDVVVRSSGGLDMRIQTSKVLVLVRLRFM